MHEWLKLVELVELVKRVTNRKTKKQQQTPKWSLGRVHEQRAREVCDAGRVSLRCKPLERARARHQQWPLRFGEIGISTILSD